MKNLVWIIIAVALVYYFQGGMDKDIVIPQPAPSTRTGSGISSQDFMPLFDNGKSFSSLASSGYYTIVEVYLDSCSICKRLESGYDPFLKKRSDVIIKKIHFPESGIKFSFTGSNQDEVNRQIEETNQRMESYKVCGTPHVEIYGPDKQLLQADNCGNKDGTRFLRKWISAETGISSHLL